MSDENFKGVFCRECGRDLDEDSSLPAAERTPCPNCGSVSREHRVTGRLELSATIRTSGDVIVQAPAARATATVPPPSIAIEDAISAGTFTRMVVWSKTPDAWLAEVRDASGSIVALEISFDAMDGLVLLAEHLLPPGE